MACGAATVLCASLVLLLSAPAGRAAPTAKPHVLFLVADDLRPWLGAYGDADAYSPNIDALAARSLVCERPSSLPSLRQSWPTTEDTSRH